MVLEVEKQALYERDLQVGVNLFLGAGFSRMARNMKGQALPTGDGLKELIVTELKLEEYRDLDLPSIYQIALSSQRSRLFSLLKSTFTVREYDPCYEYLRLLNVHAIYTTNIDDLVHCIFAPKQGSISKILHDRAMFSAPKELSAVIDYVALHGCVRHSEPRYVFTLGEISSAFAADQETWYVFQRELQSRPTIFVGYSLRDAGVLQALHSARERSANRWILLRGADNTAKDLFHSLGFETLVGDTAAFLEHLTTVFGEGTEQTLDAKRSFFCGAIPSFGATAQRPVRSFFLGAEPVWSDAYSSQVVKRRIFTEVKNAILSGSNPILVGVPLCGKSTLLRQLAVDLNATDTCLYFDQLSRTTFEEVLAEHAGATDKILVFIDNLIDSLEAIHVLATRPNFQFIATEASYVMDSVHFRPGVKWRVFSCSELDPADRQRIIDSVPQRFRRSSVTDLAVLDEAGEIGLFEALQKHVFDQQLRQRFRAALREFESLDREAFDAYIMACYAAECRSVVSFDMMYVFSRKPSKTYEDVYETCARISAFLTEQEIEGAVDQDYFTVRSKALAKLALEDISDPSFSRVFQRFHSVISDKIIPDYWVFRRYGYDNEYARRAFPDVRAGQAFYERLIARTNNQFNYQHGAIYLSKMKALSKLSFSPALAVLSRGFAFATSILASNKMRAWVFRMENTLPPLRDRALSIHSKAFLNAFILER
jgi:hypothetical protein